MRSLLTNQSSYPRERMSYRYRTGTMMERGRLIKGKNIDIFLGPRWRSSRRHKRLQTAKTILSKKSNARCITIPHFKLYYTDKVKKKKRTAWYWHKNRHEDQWKRIKDPKPNSHSYSHLIFDETDKNIR
jgi:hypothetical protein